MRRDIKKIRKQSYMRTLYWELIVYSHIIEIIVMTCLMFQEIDKHLPHFSTLDLVLCFGCQLDEPCSFSGDHWQMQQCFNVFIDIYKVLFLVLFHCYILLEMILRDLYHWWYFVSNIRSMYKIVMRNITHGIVWYKWWTRFLHLIGLPATGWLKDGRWSPIYRL